MKQKNKHKIVSFVAGAMAVGSVIAPSFAFAQSGSTTEKNKPEMSFHGNMFTKKDMASRAHSTNGTVVSIAGSIITMTDKKGTTYTVDATNAKFASEGIRSTLSLSNILVGDKISVRGTLSGTNIAAVSIADKSFFDRTVFSGKVTAVNGTTITLVKNKTTTYTVNAGSATLTKGFGKNAKSITLADVAVGDRLTVIGTLSGTTVTASAIDDMKTPMGKGHMFERGHDKQN
jgi:hypothetical protein